MELLHGEALLRHPLILWWPTVRRQPAMVNPKFRGRASSKTMNPRAELEDLAPVTGGPHSLYPFAPNYPP